MSNLKRISLFLLLILFTLSIIDDLSRDPHVPEYNGIEKEITIAHIKVKPGDTVLSITEEINEVSNLNIEQIITDFEHLNPGTSVEKLIPNSFYYFPLYNEP